MIANGLETVDSKLLINYLKTYVGRESVELIVVGEPRDMQNQLSDASRFVEPFVRRLRDALPDVPIVRFDERFTSKMAFQSMIDAGLSKKRRQDKALIDTISATILLQSYLSFVQNRKTL